MVFDMPNIPKGKKRYSVTLTEKKVKEFQSLLFLAGRTKNFMSAYFDADLDLGITVLKKVIEEQKDIGSKVDMESIFKAVLQEQKQLKLF